MCILIRNARQRSAKAIVVAAAVAAAAAAATFQVELCYNTLASLCWGVCLLFCHVRLGYSGFFPLAAATVDLHATFHCPSDRAYRVHVD